MRQTEALNSITPNALFGPKDVILLQVWGRKRWTLYNAPTKLPYTEASWFLGLDHVGAAVFKGDPASQSH